MRLHGGELIASIRMIGPAGALKWWRGKDAFARFKRWQRKEKL